MDYHWVCFMNIPIGGHNYFGNLTRGFPWVIFLWQKTLWGRGFGSCYSVTSKPTVLSKLSLGVCSAIFWVKPEKRIKATSMPIRKYV